MSPAAPEPSDPPARPHPGVRLARRAALFAVAGFSLYLLLPTLTEVFAQWPRLREIEPGWFVVMAAFEVASICCAISLQRLAFRARDWFAVVTSNLSGAAIERVVPGGGAAGATVQYGMLVRAGLPGARVASGLTVASLLTFAALLVLPVLALPFVLLGSTVVSQKLVTALWLGVGLFVALSVVSAALLSSERALRALARALQRLRNWILRRRPPSRDLPDRVVRERDAILRVLGRRWWQAVLFTVGVWLLDLFTLMAALAGVGARPSLIPVMIAYCVAQVLAQIPLTPGGLGLVEAGLTGTLVLAGVSAADAVLATLAYRLFSYWLPIPVGLIAALLFRHRYGADVDIAVDESARPRPSTAEPGH
jgi:uncharacterized protein (TIRG00374 family)